MVEVRQSFRNLEVWKQAMDLAMDCYRVTECFPREERFGLSSQTRGAAISVPANIAEGKGRGYSREFYRFVRIAMGSLAELETLLEIAARRQYVTPDEVTRLRTKTDGIGRMLSGLAASLRRSASDRR